MHSYIVCMRTYMTVLTSFVTSTSISARTGASDDNNNNNNTNNTIRIITIVHKLY